MPPDPAMEDKRSGDGRIWVVTCVFLLCIVGGGALLAVYIVSPAEGVDTYRYAVAGMVLVAIPWLFWLLTFLYRFSCKACRPASPTPQNSGGAAAAVVSTAVVGAGTTTIAMPAEALDQSVGGGERRVRFGGATVLDGVEGGHGGDSVVVVHVAASDQACSSPLTSRECEVPLALAMSA